MSRYIRINFDELTCQRKKWYKNFVQAEEALENMLKNPEVFDKDKLHVYQCNSCLGWHIGRIMPGTWKRRGT